jgi:hypothetical protein
VRAELRVHGVPDFALAEWSHPPTEQELAHFTWNFPAGTPLHELIIGAVLHDPWQALPTSTVLVAPYAVDAPAAVQLFDRVQRFLRQPGMPSRWQWLSLLSTLRERATESSEPFEHEVASTLLRALRETEGDEGAPASMPASCLSWLTPQNELPVDAYRFGDFLYVPHGREGKANEGVLAACQARRQLHLAAVSAGLLGLMLGSLVLIRSLRKRRARSVPTPEASST